MNHVIVTTLDTNDTADALQALREAVESYPAELIEIESQWALQIDSETAGAELRDILTALDHAGFLP